MDCFFEYCKNLGIKDDHHVIVHSSYSAIRNSFHLHAAEVIEILKKIIDKNKGSIIFPSFTYCFKKTDNSNEVYNKEFSVSKVGYLSEIFRQSDDVIRTSSPTHSFSLWGNIKNFINENNSPTSPLGKGSVCDWLVNQKNSHVLMLNVNFSSFTLGHYYEILTEVPWFDFSPWNYLHVENFGVSLEGFQELHEIPGCAKSFVRIEDFLIQNKLIQKFFHKSFYSYYFSINSIHGYLIDFFKNNYAELLCPKGSCQACDSRREKFL